MKVMRWTRFAGALALAVAVTGLAGAAPVQDKVKIWTPDAEPHGMSYVGWSEAWWHWALSFPLSESPVTDLTGELAGLGQEGPVFFLAGTFGGSAERTVTLPKGKSLFFPVVNVIGVWFPEPGVDPPTEEEFRAQADFLIEFGYSLECTIDGEEIQNLADYRAQTGLFGITVPEDGLFPAGSYEPCISDGFYLMLKPLKPGEHTIHFRGTLDLIGLETEVTYHLTVPD